MAIGGQGSMWPSSGMINVTKVRASAQQRSVIESVHILTSDVRVESLSRCPQQRW
jgi:hypothetical protein